MVGFPLLLDNALKGWMKRDPPASKTFESSRSLLKVVPWGAGPPKAARHEAELAKMVESEIIPRLMLAHRSATSAPDSAPQAHTLGPETTESFARMVLSKEPESLIEFVGTLLQSGLAMETIYVELMMPAARLLGDYWDDDSISFTDVTIGLSRLQQVVRTLGWKRSHADGPDHAARSALFAPVTSEQHTFGLFIIEDFFRRAGWRTWIETSGVDDDLVEMVRCHWFDLVGLSASSDTQIDRVTCAISGIRKASRNPDLFILVGGRLFIEQPELVFLVGADATAPSGSDALLVADKAIRRLVSNA
jgi:methanogenic corrinoid protein MtbC1